MTRVAATLVHLAAALGAVVLLVGCSTDPADPGANRASANSPDVDQAPGSSSTAVREAFNNADVTFVQGAIPQQHGALAAAQLAEGRAGDARVHSLSRRIEAAQKSDVETMAGWLFEWGEPLPEDQDLANHGPDDIVDGPGWGSPFDEALARLEVARGVDFDRLLLQAMVQSHQNAVDMAETEIAEGAYPAAVALARDIVRFRTAEIEEMKALLVDLGG
ncbi:Uncharacterized conserved protein, DUF305 family [Blastococcus aurantiacus]|uniref:Uncharacterized conserved protein, DUF305 family n=1 Tax=Blastococcus aurantiacus TaxID=1550231 RepID=A0A1G7R8T1_9ACTN|nr:DUF305 domain-containing protein [Blastococcus aurantiacus]SDG07133.1 Uncharacterized conserved protein, DUF305 family [Blastococcus aurantiacus]